MRSAAAAVSRTGRQDTAGPAGKESGRARGSGGVCRRFAPGKQRMEDVGGEDRGGAGVEAGVEIAVLAKQPGCPEDPVDRLEIVGEVGGVSRDLPEEADVDGVGKDSADQPPG